MVPKKWEEKPWKTVHKMGGRHQNDCQLKVETDRKYLRNPTKKIIQHDHTLRPLEVGQRSMARSTHSRPPVPVCLGAAVAATVVCRHLTKCHEL
ncbi:hypothetical protein EVAR_45939_1 [Eumeta japonica]|uniref:Uncharacterized protein n=1 Tax=Eumeta variegata TaxID=151549 RepID=A0A4C1W7N2_EUMVA|nr:hypothetical protein EVAR_45939_1 [Eumeta japonica]